MTSNVAISGSRVFPPPAKCAWISFLALSAFVTPFLFFLPLPENGPVVWFWPGMYLYCGLLSVVIAGLIQNRLDLVFALMVIGFILQACGVVGIQLLLLSEGDPDWMASGAMLLRIVLNLMYFLGTVILILSIRGWIVGSIKNHNKKNYCLKF